MLIKKRLLTKEELNAKDMSNIFGGENSNNGTSCNCSGGTFGTNSNGASHCQCSGQFGTNTNKQSGCKCD